MSKPTSPAAPTREPKPQTGCQAPAALRRRGIQSAAESCAPDDRLRAGDLLWRYFGRDLYRRFYTEGTS
jgi:hypothetical protein